MSEILLALIVDSLAIGILVGALFFPRHRRSDLVVAYVGINVSVLTLALVFQMADIGAGLGIGLFGVLSIIRLRSSSVDQEEVAYYFASLALGLLCGLSPTLPAWALLLALVIVTAMFIVDHPAMLAGHRNETVTLPHAIPDERRLARELEIVLGAPIRQLRVRKLDFVNDRTEVEVRYRRPRRSCADEPRPHRAPRKFEGARR